MQILTMIGYAGIGLALAGVLMQALEKWDARRHARQGFPLSRNYTTGTEGKR